MAIEIGINPNGGALDDVPELRRLAEGAGFALWDRRTEKVGRVL